MRSARMAVLARSAAPVVAAAVAWSTPAFAQREEPVVRRPGDHPRYAIEVEPHLAIGMGTPPGTATGLGPGVRLGIPLLDDGPVRTINNSLALGFGADWIVDSSCRPAATDGAMRCRTGSALWLPVVGQWNFYVSRRWSVFGEPGVAIVHGRWSGDCDGLDGFGRPWSVPCSRDSTGIEPVLQVGARYLVTDRGALTMRIGYPYLSVGGSFL